MSALDQAIATAADLQTGIIESWSDDIGQLTDGREVTRSLSCVVQPVPSDKVLLWQGETDLWVLQVLHREAQETPVTMGSNRAMAVRADTIRIQAETFQVQTGDLITHSISHHSVENLRTEQADIRITQTGTDIKKAGRVLEDIKTGLVQRTGIWVSNTLTTVRHKARTFLFD